MSYQSSLLRTSAANRVRGVRSGMGFSDSRPAVSCCYNRGLSAFSVFPFSFLYSLLAQLRLFFVGYTSIIQAYDNIRS
jgi:hypothetical protein